MRALAIAFYVALIAAFAIPAGALLYSSLAQASNAINAALAAANAAPAAYETHKR